MYFKYKSLYKCIDQYQKIIIYGTGNYAQLVYPQLVKFGLKKKIVCFAQSEVNGHNFIDGIPVTGIENVQCDKDKTVVLIAVGKPYVDKIRKTLSEYDYTNLVFTIDYQQSTEPFYHLESFQEYCELIANWYVETKKGEMDRSTVLESLLDRGKKAGRNRKKNLIVMISGNISARTAKIASALKRKKFDLVVLDYSKIKKTWFLEELYSANVKIEKCCCIEEMLYNALQYDPLVYFFEPQWGDCLWPQIMIFQKQYFGKIVISLYDVLNDGYCEEPESNLATEKYSLENADGIVWRWFSKDLLESRGFKFQGKSIQFLDYCDINNMNCSSDAPGFFSVRLCAVVGYGDAYVENRTYVPQYTEWARIGEILDKIGNIAGYEFHFYAGSLKNENIEICRKYEEQYDNFRFFVGIEHQELMNRLRGYDYGCELYIEGDEPPDDARVAYYFGSYHRNSIRNAFFDFINAGLPVITTYASKMWEYLSEYDIVLKMTLTDLDLEFLRKNRKYYKDRSEVARRELCIDKAIPSLIQFFQEV